MTAGLREHCDFCLRPTTLITSQNRCLHQRLIYGPFLSSTIRYYYVSCMCALRVSLPNMASHLSPSPTAPSIFGTKLEVFGLAAETSRLLPPPSTPSTTSCCSDSHCHSTVRATPVILLAAHTVAHAPLPSVIHGGGGEMPRIPTSKALVALGCRSVLPNSCQPKRGAAERHLSGVGHLQGRPPSSD